MITDLTLKEAKLLCTLNKLYRSKRFLNLVFTIFTILLCLPITITMFYIIKHYYNIMLVEYCASMMFKYSTTLLLAACVWSALVDQIVLHTIITRCENGVWAQAETVLRQEKGSRIRRGQIEANDSFD
jgi:hypothetical protein